MNITFEKDFGKACKFTDSPYLRLYGSHNRWGRRLRPADTRPAHLGRTSAGRAAPFVRASSELHAWRNSAPRGAAEVQRREIHNSCTIYVEGMFKANGENNLDSWNSLQKVLNCRIGPKVNCRLKVTFGVDMFLKKVAWKKMPLPISVWLSWSGDLFSLSPSSCWGRLWLFPVLTLTWKSKKAW